jgi:hypothetical protein
LSLLLKHFVHRFYSRKPCGHSFQFRVQTKLQGAILCRSSVSFIARGDNAIDNMYPRLQTRRDTLRLARHLLKVCASYCYVDASAGSSTSRSRRNARRDEPITHANKHRDVFLQVLSRSGVGCGVESYQTASREVDEWGNFPRLKPICPRPPLARFANARPSWCEASACHVGHLLDAR